MKLFRLDRTDPLSFGPKFPEILVEWIASKVWIICPPGQNECGLCREVVVVERGPFVNFFFFLKDYARFIFCSHRSVCGLPRHRSHRVLTLWISLQILSQIMKNSLRYRFLFQSKVSIVHVIIKKQLYHAELNYCSTLEAHWV